jgi:hypothetical protein
MQTPRRSRVSIPQRFPCFLGLVYFALSPFRVVVLPFPNQRCLAVAALRHVPRTQINTDCIPDQARRSSKETGTHTYAGRRVAGPEESLPVLRDVATALYRQKAKW